jgi:hypothetical protein
VGLGVPGETLGHLARPSANAASPEIAIGKHMGSTWTSVSREARVKASLAWLLRKVRDCPQHYDVRPSTTGVGRKRNDGFRDGTLESGRSLGIVPDDLSRPVTLH